MDRELFDNSMLPPELDEPLRAELRPDERLLWVGQPNPGRFARQAIPLVLIGIPWTAFSVFWVVMASGAMFAGFGNGAPGWFGAVLACFPLFGVPFVVIGLGMLSSPYWMWLRAQRTCYAITDRRAIIRSAGTLRSVEVRSYEPSALGRIYRKDYADGTGDLVFEEVVSFDQNGARDRTTRTVRHGFMAVPQVRKIDELLREALLANKPASEA